MFQQDSAPAHRARETIKLLQRETPAFISPDLWPPNSPDLNLVNYKICGVMQDRVYQKKMQDMNELRGDESSPLHAYCEHDETPAWLPPHGVTGLLRSSP